MAFAHFFRSYDYALRNTGNKDRGPDLKLLFGVHRKGGGYLDLDVFRCRFANQQIVLAL